MGVPPPPRVTYESWSQFRLYSANQGWLLLTMFNSEFEGWNLLGRPQRYNLYPSFSQMCGFIERDLSLAAHMLFTSFMY